MLQDLDAGEPPLHFGVGCLTLDLARPAGTKFGLEEWANLVEKTLLSVPNIENVAVHAGMSPGDQWNIGPAPTKFLDVATSRPEPLGAFVGNDVTIPRRMHSALHPHLQHPSERFRVETSYGFYAPVTFVTCLDVPGDGSDAVILVREFLNQEIPRRTDDLIPECLGPSPFHVDFVLEASQAILEWKVERTRSRAYDELRFSYPTSQFATLQDAKAELLEQLEGELGLFYRLQRQRDRRLHMAVQLTNETESLIATHQAKGICASLKRLFRSSKKARELGVVALQAKLLSASEQDESERDLSSLYSGAHPLAANREQLESTASELFGAATTNALEVVTFLEGSRTKEVEVAVVAASTLMGAAAGAVAALISGS